MIQLPLTLPFASSAKLISAEDVKKAHVSMLICSMETLNEEGSDVPDVLEWVFAPPFVEKIVTLSNGSRGLVRLHQHDIPFSFLNCCRAAGVSDPHGFREGIVQELPEKYRVIIEAMKEDGGKA